MYSDRTWFPFAGSIRRAHGAAWYNAGTNIKRAMMPVFVNTLQLTENDGYTFDIQAVSKHFGIRTFLDELSISLADGERVRFLGPDGAGKTTFLRILAGLEQPDCGNVNRRRAIRIGFLPH